jgi:Flp pilus assembly protein TadG
MTQRTNRLRRFWRDREGIAAVELALILPLIALLLAVSLDMGRILFDYHAASKSVRDAVRFLTRVDGSATGLDINCGAGTVNAGSVDALRAMRLAMYGQMDGSSAPGARPLVKTWTNDASLATANVTITIDCYDNTGGGGSQVFEGYYEGVDQIESLVVSATVPFNFQLGGILGIGPAVDFTITHKMIHIGT